MLCRFGKSSSLRNKKHATRIMDEGGGIVNTKTDWKKSFIL